ncbi:MAG: hypothetical protein K0R14_251 [Burkholderiales bacterium]|jgi:hypothetical protein|nr:hypothetical protein [Burkholderiales bacterium]
MKINSLSLNLLLPDGSFDGLVIVSSTNWAGNCIKFPRINFDKVFEKYKKIKSGVYFLFGENDKKPLVYVGESEDIQSRIRQHLKDNDKSWLEEIVIFTSSNNSLTKGHIKNLEYKLIKAIRKSVGFYMDNGNVGTESWLPEYMQSDVNIFFEHILLIMPMLGFNQLFSIEKVEQDKPVGNLYYFYDAKGAFFNNKFRVIKSSKINIKETNSCHESIKIMRKRLIETNVINADTLTFNEDYDFNSPSTAAAIIYGGNKNGWTAWKNITGNTLHEIEREFLDRPVRI